MDGGGGALLGKGAHWGRKGGGWVGDEDVKMKMRESQV